MGGVIKQIQHNKANPPPERDSRLPPKPAGQTVGSFKNGLMTLPNAIAARLDDKIRYDPSQRHTLVNKKDMQVEYARLCFGRN